MPNPQPRRLLAVVAVLSLAFCAVAPATVSAAPDAAAPAPAAAVDPAPAAPAPAAPAPAAPAPAAPAPAAPPPAAAPPPPPAAPPAVVGSYDVTGIAAVDKSKYHGVVSVSKKGEAYHVNYEDSDGKFKGIAFLTGNVLGIAYSSENKSTLCQMEPEGTNGWRGRCMEQGDSFLDTEVWTRR